MENFIFCAVRGAIDRMVTLTNLRCLFSHLLKTNPLVRQCNHSYGSQKIPLTHFGPRSLFYTLRKPQKTYSFPTFFGGIEM